MQDRSQLADLDTDVVIVGYGPVGATLANLLGLRGVKTVVLEREHSAYHLPRAVHFDDEVMRIFETVGLSDAIVTNTVFSPGMHFVDSAGKLMLDWSRPPGVTPQGWHPSYRFHQPDLEGHSARRPQALAMRLDNDTMRRLCARRRRRWCSRPLRGS